jgi:chromosome segregation ATPase
MKTTRLLFLLSVVALMTACAARGTPPTDELAVARSAIGYAEESSARDSAPEELADAQRKLSLAREAVEARNYEVARQLAVEAEAAARLADLKARNASTRRTVNEIEASIEALRSELAQMQRGGSS